MAVHRIVAPVAWKTASKERVKFDPRSRIRNLLRHEVAVRREALENRGRCETSSLGCRSSPVGAGRSLIRETPGRAGSSADKAGTVRYCQTGRVRRARSDGIREEPVVKLRKRVTGSNLVDMGRGAAHGRLRAADFAAGLRCRWGGHGESLRRSRGDAAGAELDAKPVNRFAVNTGTVPCRSRCPGSTRSGGIGPSSAEGTGGGGGPVVVRARERRAHGQGGQQVSSRGQERPGGRR